MYPLYFVLRFFLMLVHWRRQAKAHHWDEKVKLLNERVKSAKNDLADDGASIEKKALAMACLGSIVKEREDAAQHWEKWHTSANCMYSCRRSLACWSSRNIGWLMGVADAGKVFTAWYFWAEIVAWATGLYLTGKDLVASVSGMF